MERLFVSAGIRLIGLWWIFFEGGSNLYYIIIKRAGLLTSSSIPFAYNEQSAIFDVLFGVAVILIAPLVALAIFGADKKQTSDGP